MRFHGHRDMLHDADRNEAYARAIAEAVRRIRNSSDSEPYAVDIGAGSGLLGLIAARAGAAVTAFEVVPALARLAERVAADNALPLEVINAHSTEASGRRRASLMTHELLDSGLLGEGLLPALRHAWHELLEDGALSVPSSISLFVQPVHSTFLRDAAHLSGAAASVLGVPAAVGACAGGPQFFELRASALIREEELVPLNGPVRAVDIDMTRPPASGVQHPPPQQLPQAKAGGGASRTPSDDRLRADALLTWWECTMLEGEGGGEGGGEAGGELRKLSTSPWEEAFEREHWMQAAFLLPAHAPDPASTSTRLHVAFDDHEIWMALRSDSPALASPPHLGADAPARPFCTCGMHCLWGHERLQELNRLDYAAARAVAAAFVRRVRAKAGGEGGAPRLLDAGDGPLWSILASEGLASEGLVGECLAGAGEGVGKCVCAEVSAPMRTLSARFVASSGASCRVEVKLLAGLAEAPLGREAGGGETSDSGDGESDMGEGGGEGGDAGPDTSPPPSVAPLAVGLRFDAVVIAPSFATLKRCWGGEQLAECVRRRRWAEAHGMVALGAPMLPCRAVLRACLVECSALWMRHAPVGDVAGLDVRRFNKLCRPTGEGRSLPLWQYSHAALSPAATWCETALPAASDAALLQGRVRLTARAGTAHALIAWVDFDFGDAPGAALIRTGPTAESGDVPRFGPTPCWQGAVFLPTPRALVEEVVVASLSLDLLRGELRGELL